MAKLYFRYAAMNAGKSTHLLQIAHNYNSLGKDVLLMTAKVDNRFGVGRITSRLGLSQEANVYTSSDNLFDTLTMYNNMFGDAAGAVLVDEAQFLTAEQVQQLHKAVHKLNLPVLCFGLRSDFRGQPFEGAAMLLTLAEDIEELKNVCACGAKATMNMRVDGAGNRLREGPQVQIGDALYKQACAKCFYQD